MSELPPTRPAALTAVHLRPTASILRLGLHGCSPLVLGGLRLMLEPHTDRVRIKPSGAENDVLLVDAAHRCGPPRLPEVDVPVVVLVREGDLAAARLVKHAGGAPVAVTARAEALVQVVESAYRASRSPHRAARHGLHGVHAMPPQQPETPHELVLALSAREEQVLSGVCAGMSNEDIAAELYVSINSIKTYIRSAYRKMGVTRRGQAVVWGMRHGYGEPVGDTRAR